MIKTCVSSIRFVENKQRKISQIKFYCKKKANKFNYSCRQKIKNKNYTSYYTVDSLNNELLLQIKFLYKEIF